MEKNKSLKRKLEPTDSEVTNEEQPRSSDELIPNNTTPKISSCLIPDKVSRSYIVYSLLRAADCPVCLLTIRIPFKMCAKGHGICNSCTEKLEVCPICQGALILENPVCMKNLLEALRHAFNYVIEDPLLGTRQLVSQKQDDDHENCGQRPIVCRMSECEKTVPVMNILDHYKSEHPSILICKEEFMKITVPAFDPRVSFWNYLPVSLFGNLFWILTIHNTHEGYFEMYFQATPIVRLEKDCYVQVKFEKGKFAYSFTLKASVLHPCTPKCNDVNPYDAVNYEIEYFLRIPPSELINFVNDDGKLEYSLTFFEKAK